jgi:hypothetical protein
VTTTDQPVGKSQRYGNSPASWLLIVATMVGCFAAATLLDRADIVFWWPAFIGPAAIALTELPPWFSRTPASKIKWIRRALWLMLLLGGAGLALGPIALLQSFDSMTDLQYAGCVMLILSYPVKPPEWRPAK